MRRLAAALALLAGAACLGGCALQAPQAEPPVPRSAAAAGLAEQPTPEVAERWWQALGDDSLNTLVDQALQGSPGLALANARVARAWAQAGLVQAGAGLQGQAGAEATWQRFSEHALVPPTVTGSSRVSTSLLTLWSWNPDLNGQRAAQLAAAAGQARAAQADAALAATALAAQLARGQVALAHVLAQRALSQRLLAQRTDLLRLIHQRVKAGLGTAQELALGEAALPEARAQAEALSEQAVLLRRALAVLAGLEPGALRGHAPQWAALQLPPLPAAPGAGLLGRRPDVVAARWRVQAASEGVAEARAQFYPDINLSAVVGLQALGLHHLLDLGSRSAAVTPALRLPLFDAGRLRAQHGVRQAELHEAVAQYDAVLLQAVREAGDALASAHSLQVQQQEQAAALTQAEAAYRIARQRYAAGLTNQLALLHTETQWLAQQRQALALQERALLARIALMQALGGGWAGEAKPTQNPKNAP